MLLHYCLHFRLLFRKSTKNVLQYLKIISIYAALIGESQLFIVGFLYLSDKLTTELIVLRR